MKSKIQFLIALAVMLVMLSAVEAKAQAPQLFNYQGIARDAKGNPLSNQTMTLKLSVLPTSDATDFEYEEIQTVKTNEFGLYTLQIGNGSSTSAKKMKDVKWETGNKYIKVGVDPKGGQHFEEAGTNQLLSVPYAIYADKSGVAIKTETDKTRTGAVNSNAAHVAGDANYISKFTAFNEIGKSLLYDNGSAIGIGTTSPSARFQISQNVAAVQEHIRMQNASPTGAGRFTMYNDGASSYATFTKYGSGYAGGYAGIPALYPLANLLAFGNNGVAANDGLGRFLISSGGNIGISIAKSGTSKLKFHADFSTENVGIGGSASPANRVHLNNSDGADMTVGVTNNTSGHLATDGLVIRENGNAASIINMENSTLALGTNSTTRLTITAAGNTELTGQIKIAGGAPGAGKVLTSDANGLATWATAAGGGNISGTGTTNYLPVFSGANNIVASTIYQDGANIGIGNATPNAPLHFANVAANRKAVLYEVADNDHQFFGLGINSGLMRYQVGDVVNNHVFYAGATAVTSNELMRIQGNGNVGIGTASPVAKLDVAGQIKISGGSPGAGKVLTSDAAGLATWATPAAGGISGSGTANRVARFITPSSIGNGIIFDNGTNVGLEGNTAPNAPLQFANSPANRKIVLFEGGNNDHQFLDWATCSVLRYQIGATLGSHIFYAGATAATSNELMRIQGDGNVGIGTATPNAPLQFSNAQASRKIVLYENANNDHSFYGFGINAGMIRYQVGAVGGNHVFFSGINGSSSKELMRIQGNGNVGIGTDTANAPLQFANAAANRKIVMYENANNDNEYYGFGINSAAVRYQVATAASSHIFFAGTGAASSAELMRIKGDGNIGIGTSTPNAPLQFGNTNANRKIVLYELANNDHNFMGFGVNGGALRYQVQSSAQNHIFYAGNGVSASTEIMRIQGNGNVGIGIAAPTQKLHVFNGTTNGTYTTTGWVHSSDARLKTNIKPLENSLNKILSLKGVSYNWKASPNTNTQVGFIAQDVEKVFPEVVVVDSDGKYGMAYQNLVAPMVEAIKELHQQNEDQKKLIEDQQKINLDLMKRLEALEKK
ncbi:MAG: tail fiber domain-containing protein [Bacteroidetes bacterium]|nr:tail fiber domain-containing protein [Bacteroidota bacterium]